MGGFGLPDPEVLAGIALRFQIAQKIHAVSDPHDPPNNINDRARDVVDLLLLRDITKVTGEPSLEGIRIATEAVFEARAKEARELGQNPRSWPPTIIGHAHWTEDFARAATSAKINISLTDAIISLEDWIDQISTL